ncbi:MAG: hypothetical protein JW760_10580, partial [Spirochaetales bacterium]|nr:hypothetical protein [Spirochaetales bacterium]
MKRLVSGLMIIITVSLLLTCGNPLLEQIEQDIEEYEESLEPRITLFSLTSENPTNNQMISFDLQGSENISQWCIDESDTPAGAGSDAWKADKPATYTLSEGDGIKTVYARGMDTAGTISEAAALSVTLDTEKPVIETFSLTSESPTDQRAITFALSGSSDITGWLVKEDDAAAPASDSAAWLGEKPAGYTIAGSNGTRTIYAFARDDAGNVSSGVSFTVELVTTPSASYAGETDIVGHESIIITFTDSMDTGTVTVTGDIGSDGKSLDWGGTTDTLTITPTNHWTVGAGKTLVINGDSTGGLAMEEFSESFDITARMHVSTAGTNNPAYGTTAHPCATIQYAITRADSLYETAEVFVASGTYGIDGRTGDGAPIEMKSGISVYGGYSPADWSTRDTAGQPSIIQDTSAAPGTGYLTNIVVSFLSTVPRIDNGTALDGFTLLPGTNSGSAYDRICGISCEGSDPTIRDVTIEGNVGTNTNITLYGLYIANSDDSSPVLDDCVVFETWNGGSCDYSYALFNYGDGTMTVQDSSIFGGRAVNDVWSIFSFSGDTVTGCTIKTGRAGNESIGLYAYAGSSSISGCTIYIGDDSGVFTMYNAFGIWAGTGGSTPAIDSNTFYWNYGSISGGVCYAIWEAGSGDDPSSVSGNHFDDDFISNSSYGYYRDE